MKTKDANKIIAKGLIKMWATDVSFQSVEKFLIETKYGTLQVILAIPRDCRGKNATISCYSRFLDVDKAKTGTNCNPYSGKWNWVFWAKDFTAKSFANKVLGDIKDILKVGWGSNDHL